MNKARTAISYTLMGMRLGCSVIDKINLGTMLFRYKTKLLLKWPRKIHCVNIKGLIFPLFIREEDIDILYSIFYRKDYLRHVQLDFLRYTSRQTCLEVYCYV